MTFGLSQPSGGPLSSTTPSNGGFAAACFIHTSFYFSPAAPTIGGYSYLDALSAWYFGHAPEAYKLIDTCVGFKCGTNCPS